MFRDFNIEKFLSYTDGVRRKKFFVSFFLLFTFFLLEFIFKLLFEDFYDLIAEPFILLTFNFFLLEIFKFDKFAFKDFLDLNVKEGSKFLIL